MFCDANDVAGAVLVLGEQEDAVYGISYEGLCSESEREAGDAQSRDDRGDINADLVKDYDQADDDDQYFGGALDYEDDGVGALIHLVIRCGRAAHDGSSRQMWKECAEEHVDGEDDDDNEEDRRGLVLDVLPLDREEGRHIGS